MDKAQNGEFKSKMVYRYLGNSGLKVSVLGIGNWINVNEDYESFKLAYENGINFFDTAEVYGFGKAETTLGENIKRLNVRREDIVVTTKISRCGPGVNDAFQSRKHIIEGVNNSLKRLQLDYVDVIYSHRPDRYTPIEETCRAYNWVIEQGKAFYWGTSEWSPSQLGEAYVICEKLNLIKPIVEQCQYNMLVRDRMESEYTHLFKSMKLGTTTWSPLFSGILTGKYINEVPTGSRMDASQENARIHFDNYQKNKEGIDQKLMKLKALAEKLGFTLPQLAITWVIKNTDVSTCILGVTSQKQMAENLRALDCLAIWTNEVEIEVNDILGNAPLGEMDWLSFKRLPSRREILCGIEPQVEKK